MPGLVEPEEPHGMGMLVRPWHCCCSEGPVDLSLSGVCLGFRAGNVLIKHPNISIRLCLGRGASKNAVNKGIMSYELRNEFRLEIKKVSELVAGWV